MRTAGICCGWMLLAVLTFGQQPVAQPEKVEAAISPDFIHSQNPGSPNLKHSGNIHQHPDLVTYRFAKGIRDYPTATFALTTYVANHPDHLLYQDSLIMLHFETQNLAPCIYLSDQVLQSNPQNAIALEYAGLSYQILQQPAKAITYFEHLWESHPSANTLYIIASLQFELERNKECRESIQKLLQMPLKDEFIQLRGQTNIQNIPLQAAVHNLAGNLAERAQQPGEARKHYSQAISLFPDFELAKNNLTQLETHLPRK